MLLYTCILHLCLSQVPGCVVLLEVVSAHQVVRVDSHYVQSSGRRLWTPRCNLSISRQQTACVPSFGVGSIVRSPEIGSAAAFQGVTSAAWVSTRVDSEPYIMKPNRLARQGSAVCWDGAIWQRAAVISGEVCFRLVSNCCVKCVGLVAFVSLVLWLLFVFQIESGIGFW